MVDVLGSDGAGVISSDVGEQTLRNLANYLEEDQDAPMEIDDIFSKKTSTPSPGDVNALGGEGSKK